MPLVAYLQTIVRVVHQGYLRTREGITYALFECLQEEFLWIPCEIEDRAEKLDRAKG